MKWLIKMVAAVVLGSACTSCSSDEDSGNGPINPNGERVFSPLTLTPAEVKLGVDIKKVGIGLFQAESEVNSTAIAPKNTLVSPWNQYMFLAMLMNGANDSIQEKVMARQGITSMEEMNAYMKRVTEYLMRADARVNMSSFNGFWYDNNLSVSPSYESLLRDFYNAEVNTADFGSLDGTYTVNAWGKKVTQGYLDDFLQEEEGPLHKNYFLASAMVFEGQWQKKFTRLNGANEFHNLDGSTVMVSMMNGEFSDANCYTTDRFSKTAIPYGNGAYSMNIILPVNGVTPTELLRENAETLFADMEELRDRNGENERWIDGGVSVTMPIMDLKADATPNLAFVGAGYGSLLDRYIALEKMGECGTTGHYGLPDSVKSQIHVIINEEGTKVISATYSGMVTSPGRYWFNIDRPFICYISEKSTNAIVFAAVINVLK